MMLSTPFCLDAMWGALKAPVRLECGADTEKVRQRCYRARQKYLAQGDDRFVILRFQIDRSTLVISRHPDPVSRWHGHRLRMLREMRAFIAEYGARAGRPIGESGGAKDSGSDEG